MATKKQIFTELYQRYPSLELCKSDIKNSCMLLTDAIRTGGKILLCGNGGSSADCEHISGELLKGFLLKRSLNKDDSKKFEHFEGGSTLCEKLQYGICAIPLNALMAAYTAYLNDADAYSSLAQLVFAIGRKNDVLICISTSGNSENVYRAAVCAKACEMKVMSLTGKNESRLTHLSDCCVRVPEVETFKIQELHLPVYHTICAVVEEEMFGG